MSTAHKPPSLLFRIEQRFVAVAMAVMGAVVFFDVLHRTASRSFSPVASVVMAAVAVVVVAGALRARGAAHNAKTWLTAIVAVIVGYGGLRVFLLVLPNGLVWSQTLGLVLMLWVGVIGASMAAREHRHLALDMGSKVWPKSALPYVQAVGNAVTALFCLTLCALSLYSIRDHYGDYADTDGAGGIFAALAIPKWIAFLGIPVGFALMAMRFFILAKDGVVKKEIEEDDALHMLGLDAPEENASASKEAP